MTHIEQNCENIVVDTIPEMIRNYTDKQLPTDITDDEIDLWLAVLPDLIAFWEARVVEKRKKIEITEQDHKMTVALAFNSAPEGLAVKVKENIAHTDAKVIATSKDVIEAQYSMQLTQVMYNKVECKAKSIHKIASLRARRLEVGVVAPSIRGNPEARRNPVARPQNVYSGTTNQQPTKTPDAINTELRKELSKDLNEEVF